MIDTVVLEKTGTVTMGGRRDRRPAPRRTGRGGVARACRRGGAGLGARGSRRHHRAPPGGGRAAAERMVRCTARPRGPGQVGGGGHRRAGPAAPGPGPADFRRSSPTSARPEQAATAVLAGWDGQAEGAIAVADTVRPSAAGAVAELRGLGLRPVLLTGDNAATARAVANAAGIDEYRRGAAGQKADYIAQLRAAGHAVAMVGDGVNDGPALARATLGLAIGSGTDVAICAADLILLRDDLRIVPDAIRLARGTFTTIRRNLAWAFGYNLAAIPLAAAGLLNPLIAAATMTFSSAFVIGNSLRLRRFQRRRSTGGQQMTTTIDDVRRHRHDLRALRPGRYQRAGGPRRRCRRLGRPGARRRVAGVGDEHRPATGRRSPRRWTRPVATR